MALAACGKSQADKEAEAKDAAYREKYAKAKALFEERCKTAGIVVKRIVVDVEGIELIKVRPKLDWADKRYFDPMFDGAAMADEAQGDSYIASFLYSELRNRNKPKERGLIQPTFVKSDFNQEPPRRGYRYVDVPDASSDQIWRYQIVPAVTDAEFRRLGGWAKDLERTQYSGKAARYAVSYQDIVDAADRAFWIAGTRIKIVDQQTDEVIAQLTRFVWDPGFGVSTAGRWPWQHVDGRSDRNCPKPYELGYQTRKFVDTVLIPKQGD